MKPRRYPPRTPQYRPKSVNRSSRRGGNVQSIFIISTISGVIILFILIGVVMFRFLGSPVSTPTTIAVATEFVDLTAIPLRTPKSVPTNNATTSTSPITTPVPFNTDEIRILFENEIDQSRIEARADALTWDTLLSQTAQAHALEMAELGYASHLNLEGEGPDHRYAQLGGSDAVREIILVRDDIIPTTDWNELIRDIFVKTDILLESNTNLIDTIFTHGGIGVAYNESSHSFKVVILLSVRLLTQWVAPTEIGPNENVTVRGTLLDGVSSPSIELWFEPIPIAFTISDLPHSRKPYQSAAVIISPINTTVRDDSFVGEVQIPPNSQPGYYHIRVYADSETASKILTIDALITLP